jgi:hypothetical protein
MRSIVVKLSALACATLGAAVRTAVWLNFAIVITVIASPARAQGALRGEWSIADRSWTVGVESGDAQQEFGKLVAAAADRQGRTYLLDAATSSIHVVNGNGVLVGRLGRSGRGPGELAEPMAMIHDGVNTLYVLDRANGLLLFDTKQGMPKYRRSVLLRAFSDDVCLMGPNAIVLHGRTANNHHVTVIDSLGKARRTFGGLLGDTTKLLIARSLNSAGRVACLPRVGRIVLAVTQLSTVRIYDTTGVLRHSFSDPAFVPPAVLEMGDGKFAIGPPTRNGNNRHNTLSVVGDANVLLQYSWSVRPTESSIVSCILSAVDGGCSYKRTDLPLIAAAGTARAVSIVNEPFPQASQFRVDESQF